MGSWARGDCSEYTVVCDGFLIREPLNRSHSNNAGVAGDFALDTERELDISSSPYVEGSIG